MNENKFVCVREYFSKGKFIVPCYQRGYKWSLQGPDKSSKTHLDILLEDLIEAFNNAKEQDYYLQGVTVKETDEKGIRNIELVDGQQRTTSLFLILLFVALQKNLELETSSGKLKLSPDCLSYEVRQHVKTWIACKCTLHNTRCDQCESIKDSKIQDLAAFDQAWEKIEKAIDGEPEHNKLNGSKNDFIRFVLEKVKLIYVVINTDSTQVFSMMNQDKAVMTKTDLVKANLLSEASRQAFEDLQIGTESHEWQINHLRSHFAREWDSWRKRWEDEKFFKYFNKAISKVEDEPQISCLLRLYLDIVQADIKPDATLFEKYANIIADIDANKIEAIETFEGLRKLQHILQEWYDCPVIYNWLGLALRSPLPNKLELLKELYDKHNNTGKDKCREWLKDYSKWAIAGYPISDFKESKEFKEGPKDKDKIQKILASLSEENVYEGDGKEDAFRQLLRMNIEMLGTDKKFSFDWYDENRSLEHIYPKSKCILRGKTYKSEDTDELSDPPEDTDNYLTFGEKEHNEGISPHCIGNLVLLGKGDNSSVGTNMLAAKKAILYTKVQEGALLLHTLGVLSKGLDSETASIKDSADTWTIDDIKRNKEYFINQFNKTYSLEEK